MSCRDPNYTAGSDRLCDDCRLYIRIKSLGVGEMIRALEADPKNGSDDRFRRRLREGIIQAYSETREGKLAGEGMTFDEWLSANRPAS